MPSTCAGVDAELAELIATAGSGQRPAGNALWVIGSSRPASGPSGRDRDEAVLLSREHDEQQEAAVRQLEELERLGAVAMVRDRLADDRFSEGTVDDLFAAVDDPA